MVLKRKHLKIIKTVNQNSAENIQWNKKKTMPWIMSNVQLVCKDTEPLESLYYWVAYVICDTSLCCENMLWKYGVILLTDTIEQNIVYEHLESDPLNP